MVYTLLSIKLSSPSLYNNNTNNIDSNKIIIIIIIILSFDIAPSPYKHAQSIA